MLRSLCERLWFKFKRLVLLVGNISGSLGLFVNCACLLSLDFFALDSGDNRVCLDMLQVSGRSTKCQDLNLMRGRFRLAYDRRLLFLPILRGNQNLLNPFHESVYSAHFDRHL